MTSSFRTKSRWNRPVFTPDKERPLFIFWYAPNKEMHRHETNQWLHAFQKAASDVAQAAGTAKTIYDLGRGAWAIGRAVGPFLF